ncbi:MAG: Hpt domain-containing protein [Candidatus Saccharicenans sp.]|nr:Hpt domain-containing protein [Candidatus Saccharicenans sp.]MDH7575986.1 Hpt domain-containing protein [Candidatus Saccharicenans sp.]
MAGKNSAPAPIDRKEALERIGGDEAFLQELLGIYDEEFQKKYDELEKAVQEKDFQVIREAGHYLKGASANLSLPALREAAWKMEQAGQNQDLKTAREALEALEREYRRLKDFLKESG